MGLLMCQLMFEWFTHGAYEMVCRTHNHEMLLWESIRRRAENGKVYFIGNRNTYHKYEYPNVSNKLVC